jgi:hypothetical protein
MRPLSERCLFWASTAGPPTLPTYWYNDLHRIVQTEDSIMILSEMVHDARIVRMNAQHLPKTIRRWMGSIMIVLRRTLSAAVFVLLLCPVLSWAQSLSYASKPEDVGFSAPPPC